MCVDVYAPINRCCITTRSLHTNTSHIRGDLMMMTIVLEERWMNGWGGRCVYSLCVCLARKRESCYS
jgi:hypothetical protein